MVLDIILLLNQFGTGPTPVTPPAVEWEVEVGGEHALAAGEEKEGKVLGERETGSGAELQCQWKRSWMPVGGSTSHTIDPRLSQDA